MGCNFIVTGFILHSCLCTIALEKSVLCLGLWFHGQKNDRCTLFLDHALRISLIVNFTELKN